MCGTHLVENQIRPRILIKLEIREGGRAEKLYCIFKQVWFAIQATEVATQIHMQNSEGGGTEQEWAAGNYRSKWAVWGARETRRYKWQPALLLLSRKGISLSMLKAISCILKLEGLWGGRDTFCSTILIIQTSTEFPSKSDSPVITVWSLAD